MNNYLSDEDLNQKTSYDISIRDLSDIIYTLNQKVHYLESINMDLTRRVSELEVELAKTVAFNNKANNYFTSDTTIK